MAQIIARHSSSIVAYRCCAGVNDLDPHVIMELFPFICWHSAKPMPWCPDASVSTVTALVGSKCLVSNFAVSSVLRLSNSCWCSGNHWNTFYFPRSCRSAVVAWEKSGMKKESCCARPRNDLMPVRLVGGGKHVIAFTHSGSGRTPPSPTMYPAKGRLLPMANFFLDRVIFSFWQLWAIVSTLIFSSGREGAQTSMSSTIFFAQGSPSMIVSDLRHHSLEDAFTP